MAPWISLVAFTTMDTRTWSHDGLVLSAASLRRGKLGALEHGFLIVDGTLRAGLVQKLRSAGDELGRSGDLLVSKLSKDL